MAFELPPLGLDHGAVPALQQAVLAVVQAARLDPQFALGEQLAATVVQVSAVDPDGCPLQAAALVVQRLARLRFQRAAGHQAAGVAQGAAAQLEVI
ncbi:hypothetical protein BN889_06899 [Pseudomonas aeruginosa PA38182]|nr:hypothetical protein BN889_06899 [Pseudomonas aeruginosa PA38182]